ncbi:hypothetical protein AAHA92_13625 [Salvia divinorum]|uniref:Uncharacterized protein n=1 Tax=Salvia divinorum TaxID=28513 RepID=A0ABD1HCP8_SALDI
MEQESVQRIQKLCPWTSACSLFNAEWMMIIRSGPRENRLSRLALWIGCGGMIMRNRNKKPDTSFINLSTLHMTARCLVAAIQIVLKVGGKWSNEYNEDLVQFAIAKLRSSPAPSISNNNNPLAVAVGTANKLSNSCSSSYNIHRHY